tara:strand:+ start:181 stop:804 length:624 start_codon:yes stop_codon:yes gene_type:complete
MSMSKITNFDRIKRRYSWQCLGLVVGLISGLIIAILTVFFTATEYRARVEVSFLPTAPDLGAIEAADRIAANYGARVTSPAFAELVPVDLRDGLSARNIADSSSARAISKEARLVIEVEARTRESAMIMADALANLVVMSASSSLSPNADGVALQIGIIEPAWSGKNPVRPNIGWALLAGSLFGGIAGLVVGQSMFWLRQHVEGFDD